MHSSASFTVSSDGIPDARPMETVILPGKSQVCHSGDRGRFCVSLIVCTLTISYFASEENVETIFVCKDA